MSQTLSILRGRSLHVNFGGYFRDNLFPKSLLQKPAKEIPSTKESTEGDHLKIGTKYL